LKKKIPFFLFFFKNQQIYTSSYYNYLSSWGRILL